MYMKMELMTYIQLMSNSFVYLSFMKVTLTNDEYEHTSSCSFTVYKSY